jgi:hypothetical protein
VAGIVGNAANNSRIRGSNASTADPTARRSYLGGPSKANAERTVFRDTPNTRAITLIDNPSARCNRRISAQSPTTNTPLLPPTLTKIRRLEEGSKLGRRHGVSFPAARTAGLIVEKCWA